LCGALAFAPATSAEPKFKILHHFDDTNLGIYPVARPIRDKAGNLYGTTENAGGCCGVVYRLAPDGTYAVLYAFKGEADGAYPDAASLLADDAGNLYGTTHDGGSDGCTNHLGCGTVFKLTPSGQETILHAFAGGLDGAYPSAGLIADGAGNLYGTTAGGGGKHKNQQHGTVYKLTPDGQETILHAFEGARHRDGDGPRPAMLMDEAGNMYGTTQGGGDFDFGTVFKLSPNGKEKVLYSFTGQKDGFGPYGGVIRDAAGNLYGTATAGGKTNSGTVFRLAPDGIFTILHEFAGGPDDGSGPTSTLTMNGDGNLYGTTAAGGANMSDCFGEGCGTVFKLAPDGTETILHDFATRRGDLPWTGVILDNKGNLYGTTWEGGSKFGSGTLFEITP
jgi:uncharacterized repeat protein (TIGR03803 family)